jgi:streptomycin 6-kinase
MSAANSAMLRRGIHQAMFDVDLSRWNLTPDGDPIITTHARLLPVWFRGEPAMLKIAAVEDQLRGATVMEWWDGEGAARVLARHGEALLLERATGTACLAEMARTGSDEGACRVLCAVASRLHAPRAKPLPELIPLADWFRELEPAAAKHGGILIRSAQSAQGLLADPREVSVLHGDLHHGNVLDFGGWGWLAIDPKGLVGERGFDFANIFTNPDLDDPSRPVATKPGCFARRIEIVAKAARLSRTRLLCWILAWTGLSASWFLGDGDHQSAAIDLRVAEMAAAELDR